MRSVHGFCFSMTIPLLATMVRDYFPQNRRGTANSILYSANYFGTALSSMGVLLISALGWRSTYTVMGLTGIAMAGLTNLIAKDRGNMVKKVTKPNEHDPLTHQEHYDSIPASEEKK